MESSSIEDDLLYSRFLKKRKRKEILGVHPIWEDIERKESFPLLIKEQRDYHGIIKRLLRMLGAVVA